MDVQPDHPVYAGTFVHGGALRIATTRVGADSTLGKIVVMIRQAESHQARIVRSADAFAKWFTPAIVLLAGGVWAASGDFIRCVSVLVVGCPCALILATPTAIVAAMGTAAKRGLMIKGGKFLEAASEVNAVAFDKTGTLTIGRPTVKEVIASNGATPNQVVAFAAAVEQNSEHPFAAAIIEEAGRRQLELGAVTDFQSQTGLGVSGAVDGSLVRVGRQQFVHEQSFDVADNGATVLWVAHDDRCIGAIVLDDAARPSAADAIQQIKALGCSVHLWSGDRHPPVARLAGQLQIDAWQGELLPQEKVEHLKQLQDEGHKVMYVGDGVNDGPALATSYVGVAMGSGASPLALETAAVGVLNPDVLHVPALIRLGRITKRRIRENLLVFAVLYNGAAILLASFGLLAPIMAAIVHNVGSVAVVLNSARLIRWKG